MVRIKFVLPISDHSGAVATQCYRRLKFPWKLSHAFYSAAALLAMQSAVIAAAILLTSVRYP